MSDISPLGIQLDSTTKRPVACADISKIIDRLFLGSFEQGQCKFDALKERGITHILTVGVKMPPQFPNELVYKLVEIEDYHKVDISKHFQECFDFINESLSNPKNAILIHCWAGVSRSVTIVVGYLITFLGFNYEEAMEHVRRARHWVHPNSGFRKRLRDLAISKGFADTDEVSILYEKAEKVIRKMYLRRVISKRQADRVFKIFASVFGKDHPHTLNIVFEVTPYLK